MDEQQNTQTEPATPKVMPPAQTQALARTGPAEITAFQEQAQQFDLAVKMAKPMSVAFRQPVEDAVAKILVGNALGIHPAAAVQQIYVFEGKVVLASHLLLSLARQRGWSHRITRIDSKGCVLAWTSPDGKPAGESAFTYDEAAAVKLKVNGKDGSLLDKDNYKNYPADMYFARAVTRGIKRFCPEVTNGIPVRSPDEAESGDADNPADQIASATETKVAELREKIGAVA